MLHTFYRALQKRHPDVLFHGVGSRHEIALTFDDGPHPRDTPRPPTVCFFQQADIIQAKRVGTPVSTLGYMPLHFIRPTQWTINQILERTIPGSIIVMHDGKGHGKNYFDR